MQDIVASDLKTILHPQRANLYLLEHCRALLNGGHVEYVTDAGPSICDAQLKNPLTRPQRATVGAG